MVRLVATVVLTWNDWYVYKDTTEIPDPLWSDHALFKSSLGNYSNWDPVTIEQQIRWLDQAGIDVALIACNYNQTDLVLLFLDKAQELNAKVKIAIWFNGSNFTANTNLVLEGIKNAGDAVFNHPWYAKLDGRYIVSGYLKQPGQGWHLEYWKECKDEYPQLSIWACGWHPNYWETLDGVVDVMIPWCTERNSIAEINAMYNAAQQWKKQPYNGYGVTPGFDASGLRNPTSPRIVNRRDGQWYIEQWQNIKNLVPQPDIIMPPTLNDAGEGHTIQDNVESRSSTTNFQPFGVKYLNLTKTLGDAWKGITPTPLLATFSLAAIGGGIGYASKPEKPLTHMLVGAIILGTVGFIIDRLRS
ncbi:hypothetical protein ES702_01403 [subsurface metagenome]